MKPKNIDEATIAEAVNVLQHGGVIAYPTEAVYGLGCDPLSPDAIIKILQLKHRPLDKGFILIADSWDQIEPWIEPIEPRALYQVLATWPGPITWIFPAKPDVPEWLRGKNKGIAVRITDHPIAKRLCHEFGRAIVSTSANINGQPPIRDTRTVKITFGDALDMIIEGKVGDQTHPTTIKNAVTGEVIRA